MEVGTPALLETLRVKAMLLLRRERELFQLRQERRRIELWLNALHKLSLDGQSEKSAPLINDWSGAMVGELGFQLAAAYAYRGGEQLLLLHAMSHVPLLELVSLRADAREHLSRHPSGRYSNGAPRELEQSAREAGLESFFWHSIASREQKLLLVAGFAEGSSRFHPLDDTDFRHFVLLCRHLAALLDIALIAEIDRERVELSQSNTLLGSSLQRLREAQSKLLESTSVLADVSRRAGRADVATGVLHNVGNALNSVNVSAGVAIERLRAMRFTGVGRVADLLAEDPHLRDGTARERGAMVIKYLRELTHHLIHERSLVTAELRTLQENIEHIKIIVSKQQTYAMAIGVSEPCSAPELMDDAIALAELSLSALGISIAKDYARVAELVLDRHKVLQILINLISNAKHALADSPNQPKRIRTFVRSTSNGYVELGVEDNGVGISAENMTKLFTHGFTTRKHGHGFGLHTSALAAREMGGRLRCENRGAGLGACFVLELPAHPASGEVTS